MLCTQPAVPVRGLPSPVFHFLTRGARPATKNSGIARYTLPGTVWPFYSTRRMRNGRTGETQVSLPRSNGNFNAHNGDARLLPAIAFSRRGDTPTTEQPEIGL